MFVSYDSVTFGARLKELRSALRLSQQEVSERTGINSDTLRRIEHGSVVPKLETLEVLSHLFKTNLLQILDSCKASNALMTMYERLDRVILKGNAEELKQLKSQLAHHSENTLSDVDPKEVRDFKRFLEALEASYRGDDTSRLNAIKKLNRILNSRHPSFSLAELDQYFLTHFEYKVLIVLAVTMAENQEYHESNDILFYLKGKMSSHQTALLVEKQTRIKILINLSYNMHILDKHQMALKLAEEGIAFCLENDLLFGLHFLYYRKAVAHYYLNRDHETFFNLSFSTLSIQGLDDLVTHYKTTIKETYALDFF